MELYEETFQAKYPASVMELDMMQDKKVVKSTQRLLSYYRNKRK